MNNVSLCLFIWLNEVIKTLPHFCYSIRCLLLEINILGFFLHIICTYHMGLSEAHVYIYDAFQSECIYSKYVNHIYLWYHPHVYIWSTYNLYTYTMVRFKAHVHIWTLLIYYVIILYPQQWKIFVFSIWLPEVIHQDPLL